MKTYDIRPQTKKEVKPEETFPDPSLTREPQIFQPLQQKPAIRKNYRWKKIVSALLVLVMLVILSYAIFFIFKFQSLSHKINPEGNAHSTIINTIQTFTISPKVKLAGQDENRINILLLGIAGTGKPGQNLTDTILIASINPETFQVALMSLPRDLFVNVPDTHYQTKINSVYQLGLNEYKNNEQAIGLLEKNITEIIGQKINYHILLNFDGFEKIVNDIGGVNVINDRDILDTRYPGPNYSYETFELAEGFHHLDGATALKYVRTRHNDPEGDFGRSKRQQQVMQAVKNTLFSAKTLLNVFAINDLFNTLGDNLRTNIKLEEMESFLDLSKKLNTNNINNVVVDAWNPESLLKVSHVFFGSSRAFVLIPRVSGYQEIQDLAKNIFDLNQIKRRQNEIAKEDADIAIVNLSGDPSLGGKIISLLKDRFGYKNVTLLNYPNQSPAEKTLVYDLIGASKPFTLDELIKKLPATLASQENGPISDLELPENTDALVVIGKDLSALYNMEEDSINDWKDNQIDQEYFQPIEKPNSEISN